MLFSRKQKQKAVELPPFAFYKHANSFGEWLDSLPPVEGQMLGRHLLEAVREINQTECDFEQLLEISKLLETRYCGIRDTLLQNEHSKESRKNIISLKQEFFARFGRLFIKVGMVAVQSDDFENAEKFLPLASEALVVSLTSSFQLYRPPLAGGWLALHRGYLYLVSKRGNPKLAATYSEYYKAIVALACLQPAQLNSNSVDLLVSIIQSRRNQVRLSPSKSDAATHRIVAGRDQAPMLISEDESNVEVLGDCIYVDLSDLEQIADDPQCTNLLRTHLEKVFQFKMFEKTARVRTNEDFRMCMGITSIHQQINPYGSFSDFLKACLTAENDESSLEKTGGLRSEVLGSVLEGNFSATQRGDGLLELDIQNSSNGNSLDAHYTGNEKPNVQSVVALDKSTGGFLLSSTKNLNSIESGSLIGVQTDSSNEWLVAAVRWNHQSGEDCQFGVQKIASNPSAASIKIVHSQHAGNFIPALVLAPNLYGMRSIDSGDMELHIGAEQQDNTVIIVIEQTALRNKTPILFIDQRGSRKAIITETIEENTQFIVCRARFTEG